MSPISEAIWRAITQPTPGTVPRSGHVRMVSAVAGGMTQSGQLPALRRHESLIPASRQRLTMMPATARW
jgi:hypothetical protein